MAVFDVIQFEGNPSAVVWQSPYTDFHYGSQLIVDENHYAVLLIEGLTEVFGPGPHTLETQNYPFLEKIQQMFTGGKTAFPCKVYFINKVQTMDMLWGTDSKLQVMDPVYGLLLNLRLHGNLSYCVGDTPIDVKKLMEKFSGFVTNFGSDQVLKNMRGIISARVSDTVAKFFATSGVDIFTANAHLLELSEAIEKPLSEKFAEYGLKLTQFFMETITTDQDDTQEFKEARSKAMRTITDAQAAAASRAIQGFTWQEQRQMDTLQTLAGNQGTPGTFMGGMLGLNLSGPMTQPFNSMIGNNITNPMNSMSQAMNNMGGVPMQNGATQGAGAQAGAAGFPQNAAVNNPAAAAAAAAAGNTMGQQPGANGQGAPNGAAGANGQTMNPPAQQAAPNQATSNQQPAPNQPNQQQPAAATCPNCSQPVQPGWKMCPFCGTQLVKPTCPNCGQETQPGWKMCPFCGTQLN
ncbi:antifreeze protein type I [Pseudoscardovia radai]|uniref:Antifreeze protein type I n=1 Tax=Pseudoscardovia radai TaxID=987066 RepID=A0A261ERB5_9BIFI|nr:SPFH domain-containing protein [Pseudoscardovia radai]OZG49400.1 antifreeze protein type I [Pseudoscardovia radai]